MGITYRTHLVGGWNQLPWATCKRKGACYFISGPSSFTVPPAHFLTLSCLIRTQSQETSVNLSKGRVLCSKSPMGVSWKTEGVDQVWANMCSDMWVRHGDCFLDTPFTVYLQRQTALLLVPTVALICYAAHGSVIGYWVFCGYICGFRALSIQWSIHLPVSANELGCAVISTFWMTVVSSLQGQAFRSTVCKGEHGFSYRAKESLQEFYLTSRFHLISSHLAVL